MTVREMLERAGTRLEGKKWIHSDSRKFAADFVSALRGVPEKHFGPGPRPVITGITAILLSRQPSSHKALWKHAIELARGGGAYADVKSRLPAILEAMGADYKLKKRKSAEETIEEKPAGAEVIGKIPKKRKPLSDETRAKLCKNVLEARKLTLAARGGSLDEYVFHVTSGKPVGRKIASGFVKAALREAGSRGLAGTDAIRHAGATVAGAFGKRLTERLGLAGNRAELVNDLLLKSFFAAGLPPGHPAHAELAGNEKTLRASFKTTKKREAKALVKEVLRAKETVAAGAKTAFALLGMLVQKEAALKEREDEAAGRVFKEELSKVLGKSLEEIMEGTRGELGREIDAHIVHELPRPVMSELEAAEIMDGFRNKKLTPDEKEQALRAALVLHINLKDDYWRERAEAKAYHILAPLGRWSRR